MNIEEIIVYFVIALIALGLIYKLASWLIYNPAITASLSFLLIIISLIVFVQHESYRNVIVIIFPALVYSLLMSGSSFNKSRGNKDV